MHPPPLSNTHYYPAQGPVTYVPQAPSPAKSFRAGVIFTAVLALGIIIILALAGTHDQQSAGAQNVSTVAGVALLPGVAVMGWAFVPVILVLSIITMCRGGIFRGILLLCGAPLAIVLAVTVGAAVIVTTQEAAQAKTETNSARSKGTLFSALTPPTAPQPAVTRFAPAALAAATTESSVEAIRKDAIARLSRVAGLSDISHAALIREIDIACNARIAQISSIGQRKRLR